MTLKVKFLLGLIVAYGSYWAVNHVGAEEGPTDELFLLPDGYRGPFIAIYDQKGGALPRLTGETAVYDVPRTGIILIASAEPPAGSGVAHSFAADSARALKAYPTCVDLFISVTDTLPHVCWLDFQVLGTRIPDHIAGVITDRATIETNFNRTTVVYDSILFDGRAITTRTWQQQKPSQPPS